MNQKRLVIIRLGLILISSILLAIPFRVEAQNIIVKPYQQNVRPNKMVLMWETDGTGSGFVDWGLTPFTLDNTAISMTSTSDGANQIHRARITGLQPATKYYYKVRTASGVLSSLYNFRTNPTAASEQSLKFAAMSDMQFDSGNPTVFQNIIEQGVAKIANASFPNGIEDLNGILIPGDLVSSGEYSLYRNTFFSKADSIFPYVPIYPAIGNHEYIGSGVHTYLDYFDLPLNGSSTSPEEWWYSDISNVRLIGLNSNSAADQVTQLSWLQSILDAAGANTNIDFVFILIHHPFKSELWTPGELDFTGDVVAKLELFTTAYGKPSIHFFGHTHAYSRGQSRDHNHLWVNVATAGGNIDYWGEFSNNDYDEFVISEDEYGFVMLEVEAGADPKFILKRYSQGDEFTPKDNTLTEEITIKKFDSPPTTPIALFPSDDIAISCVNLKASAFSNQGNSHQATHWQIVEGCDFTDPDVIDIWKQSENWYNQINTQLNDDLTDETIATLSENKSYCWRVRYRNANLTWSDWSESLSFNTLANNDSSTSNLLLNGDAELGTTNWAGDIESISSNECGSVPAHEGGKLFAVGGVCTNEQALGIANQNIDISTYALQIDSSNYAVEYAGFLRSFATGNDQPEMYIEFLDAGNALLGTTPSLLNTIDQWLYQSGNVAVPSGTRTLNVVLKGTRLIGTDNDSYFDALSVKLIISNCPTYIDTCNDDIQNGDETGVDCGGSCSPCIDTCSFVTLAANDFETNWGIWNDGGIDCRRNPNDGTFANSGTFAIRLQDNTDASIMTTDVLDLSIYDELKIDFTYITFSMETEEDFWLQISTDGGVSYTTIADYDSNDEFVNDVREFESVIISGPFTATTSLRFRCDASANNDKVFLDDVTIQGCTSEGFAVSSAPKISNLERNMIEENNKGISVGISSLSLYPNPSSDILNISYKLTQPTEVQFIIFDFAGKEVTRHNMKAGEGIQKTNLVVKEMNSGIYLLQVTTEKDRLIKKFVVLR